MKCSVNCNALEAVSHPRHLKSYYSLYTFFIAFRHIYRYCHLFSWVDFCFILINKTDHQIHWKRYWPKSLLFIRIECAVISWCTIVAYFNSFCCGISHYYWCTEKQYWTTKYTDLLYVRKLLKREKILPNLEEYCEFLPYVKVLRRKISTKMSNKFKLNGPTRWEQYVWNAKKSTYVL